MCKKGIERNFFFKTQRSTYKYIALNREILFNLANSFGLILMADCYRVLLKSDILKTILSKM